MRVLRRVDRELTGALVQRGTPFRAAHLKKYPEITIDRHDFGRRARLGDRVAVSISTIWGRKIAPQGVVQPIWRGRDNGRPRSRPSCM